MFNKKLLCDAAILLLQKNVLNLEIDFEIVSIFKRLIGCFRHSTNEKKAIVAEMNSILFAAACKIK